MTLFLTVLLKPLVFVGLMVIVAFISALIFRLLPDGKLKFFLFKVRYDQRTNTFPTPRDKVIYWAACIVLIGGMYAVLVWVAVSN